jgi:hypothetical protein
MAGWSPAFELDLGQGPALKIDMATLRLAAATALR